MLRKTSTHPEMKGNPCLHVMCRRPFTANWFEDCCMSVFVGKDLKKKDHLELMSVDEGIILKFMLNIYDGKVGLETS